jgi:hypothetical protein
MGTILGLTCTELGHDKVNSRTERSAVMYGVATVGTDRPRMNNVHALHVYADVVEPQHVGDVMSPLIGYVNVNGKPGDRICHTCDPPIYLPVGRWPVLHGCNSTSYNRRARSERSVSRFV